MDWIEDEDIAEEEREYFESLSRRALERVQELQRLPFYARLIEGAGEPPEDTASLTYWSVSARVS